MRTRRRASSGVGVFAQTAAQTAALGSQGRRGAALLLLGCAVAGATALALSSGAMSIAIADLLAGDGLERTVFSHIRAPRVALAGLVGAVLALSGATLQGLFRNPLADPGLIGVSSGAALGAVALIVLGAPLADLLETSPFASLAAAASVHALPFAVPVAAMGGAALVTLFLYAFSARYGRFSIVTIILVGIAVNALAGVGIGAFQYLSDDAQLRTLTFWMMGSFGGANWTTVLPAALLMGAAAVPLLFAARGLDLLQLGEAEAFHLGVDVRRLKRRAILCSAAAVGAGVALAGMIGFVGLVVPHLVRLLLGAAHRYVLTGSLLLGATLTMLADLVARVAVAPAELPVGLVTSALGAPFFLWLIARAHPR